MNAFCKCASVQILFGGIFDLEQKQERLEEVNGLLEEPSLWDDPQKAQLLGKEKQSLSHIITTFKELYTGFDDVLMLEQLGKEEGDEEALKEANDNCDELDKKLHELELERMFSGPHDEADCYMDIQAGSGGTEAQDWAEMVMRMYLKFGDKHGFSSTVIETSYGEEAGIKSATLKFSGPHAYGMFRTETGVHRLVRKSPFDLSTSHHAHQEMVKGITTEMSGTTLAIMNIAEYYEMILLLGIFCLFFINSNPWSWLIAIVICAVIFFMEILWDNVSARLKWKTVLYGCWVVTLVAGGINILILMLIQ